MDQTLKQKIGVLAPSMVNQSFFCLSTVIVQMARTFSRADLSAVQLVFTLPSLMITLASLAAGKLASRFHKKTLLLTGLLMTTLGGTAGYFLSFSLPALLACSAVIGLGVGLNLTLSYAIICDYYTGAERGKLMGLNTSFVCIGGVFFSFLGGALASVAGWSAVYLSFLLLLPVVVVVWRWCPLGLLEGQGQQRGRLGLSGYFVLLTGLGFVCYTFQNSFNANSSLYLSELGRYTPALASLSSICNSGGGIVGGLLFGWLLSRLKHQIQSVAYLISGTGFVLLCLWVCLCAGECRFLHSDRRPRRSPKPLHAAGYLQCRSQCGRGDIPLCGQSAGRTGSGFRPGTLLCRGGSFAVLRCRIIVFSGSVT